MFWCFILMFVLICCILCHFKWFMLFNAMLWLTGTHTIKETDQNWQTGPNEFILHLEVLFVVCWRQIEKLVQVVYIAVSLFLLKLHKSSSYVHILMALKQFFQLERILCVHLHDILKKLLAKVLFDASFTCFSWFVAFSVSFNDLCSWTQRCGLLSCIQLRVTDQSWQTGPNESVLHFKVVFVVCEQ